jgi:hypothetical protein
MLGIKINGEFLDLLPDTQLEMEQNNPFLQFDDTVLGEYSLPIEIPTTAKNIRLTNYASLLQQKVDVKGIDAEVYINGFQHSVGKLKIEKPTINLNNAKLGTISAYYLTGISSFYQDVKDKKLVTINVGGDRIFAWDSASGFDFLIDGNGFWGHIHKVIDAPVNTYDYAFYPVINKGFENAAGNPSLLNYLLYNPGDGRVKFVHLTNDFNAINLVVPFPYLHYVLKKAVEYVGWRIEGDILNDPDFQKSTIYNTTAITWGGYSGIPRVVFGLPQVKFNLQNHLPDVSIAGFLIALRNRFGWEFDFDRVMKTIRIKPLQGVAISGEKDMSGFSSPVIVKTVSADGKIYALKNNYTTDYQGGSVDLKKLNLQVDVQHFADLPPAIQANFGHVHLVISENNYYILRTDETDGIIKWMLLTYNVFDVLPDGYNQEITTDCVTMGMEQFTDNLNYEDFLPRMDAIGGFEGSGDEVPLSNIVLLFYHGKRPNKLGQPIPYASSHIYDSAGNQVANWSLSFKCKKYDGTEVGLYDLNWKKFLDTISAHETFEVTLNLPLVDFMQLHFSDIISINNVRMYVLKIKSFLPYKGQLQLECSRVS